MTSGTSYLEVAQRVADHICEVFGAGGGPRHLRSPGDRARGWSSCPGRRASLATSTRRRCSSSGAGPGTLAGAVRPVLLPGRHAGPGRCRARGQAVRALYLAAGAVDVAVETGDDELLAAIIASGRRTLARRTYLTGGMGSRHTDEAFGDDFVLPPDRAYSETCAGVASVMLAWRLLLATGDPRYADVIERTLLQRRRHLASDDGRSLLLRQHPAPARAGPGPPEDGWLARPATSLRAPVVRGVLLPDQRGPHVRQPGRVPGHRRRRGDPDPPVRRRRIAHDHRRRPPGRPRSDDRLPGRRNGDGAGHETDGGPGR